MSLPSFQAGRWYLASSLMGCEFLPLWSRQLSSKVDRYRSSNFQSIRAQSSARSWPSVRRRWVWHRTWYKTLFRLHSKQENSLRLSSRVQLTPLNRIENISTTLSSFSIDRINFVLPGHSRERLSRLYAAHWTKRAECSFLSHEFSTQASRPTHSSAPVSYTHLRAHET